jgi:hypothetical protein
MGTTAGCGDSLIVDEQGTRARDLELVRTLESNGLTLLAAAVARRLLPASRLVADRGVAVAGRECQIFVLDQRRLAPGRHGGHGSGGTVATTPR